MLISIGTTCVPARALLTVAPTHTHADVHFLFCTSAMQYNVCGVAIHKWFVMGELMEKEQW